MRGLGHLVGGGASGRGGGDCGSHSSGGIPWWGRKNQPLLVLV